MYLASPPLGGVPNAQFSVPELADYRQRSRAMEWLVEYPPCPSFSWGRASPSRVQTGVVSANFFDVLGVRRARPRLPPRRGPAGAEPVLVLSYGSG